MGENTLFRVFGGYAYTRQPKMQPADVLDLHGLGWADGLKQILITKEYTNTTISAIVTDIMATVNAAGTGYQITSRFISTLPSNTIPYWTFVRKPAFDALKEMADLVTAFTGTGVDVWVDPAENLHFETVGSRSYATPVSVGVNQLFSDVDKGLTTHKNRLH